MGLLDGMLGGMLNEALGGAQRQAAGGGGALAALLPIVLGMLADRGTATHATAPGAGGPLGNILGAVLGGGGPGGGQAGGGGLADLLRNLEQAGFGREASSWVSSGANLPISPEAMGQIFGGGALSRIAQQAGLGEQETAGGLAQLLPEVVDRLTPDGRMPELDQLSASVDDLRGRLGL